MVVNISMLDKTNYTVSEHLFQEAQKNIPDFGDSLTLNQTAGRFFKDPWIIKDEFISTIWEEILDTIPESKGEARLIRLTPGEAYPSHADIDDRWHLNITGDNSYLIDLQEQQLHRVEQDQTWWSMDAGRKHAAANLGSEDRIQLVVRQLLPDTDIKDPKTIKITLKDVVANRRYIFDDIISPWLNSAYKRGIIDDFQGEDLKATMKIERDSIPELEQLIEQYFNIEIS
jgi:hypothetical protein